MNWKTIERPGYFGKKRAELHSGWDKKYGPGNWRIAYTWGDMVIERELAIQIYEDGYFMFFRDNPDKLHWITSIASDIYDTAPSNVEAGLSYEHQETPSSHIHDVAIRRAIMRLGETFKGDRLVHVRWTGSEGFDINPGVVAFHLPNMIVVPKIKGWWYPNSIEDFYQSNKILQAKE